MQTAAGRRLRFQLYADTLWAIHSSWRAGEMPTMYRIERTVGLTHVRLRDLIDDLQGFGFVDNGLSITERGYAFLSDVSNKVVPVLQKYGMWNGRI